MPVYYNEIDRFAAQWLRELIKVGHIAHGEVDERSIEDIQPSDLAGFTQCHFFAGIGVWSYALRRAGWPDDRPVWTGSCPCQSFSAAGKGTGFADERHLWPSWFYLIQQCRPGVIFGEQVEAAIRHGWLDLVQADLEGIGYACGSVGLPAAGFGAPHIRQRLFFVADSQQLRRAGRRLDNSLQSEDGRIEEAQRSDLRQPVAPRCIAGGMADTEQWPTERQRFDLGAAATTMCREAREQWIRADAGDGSSVIPLAHSDGVQSEFASRSWPRPGDTESWQPCHQSSGSGHSGVALGDTQQPRLEGHAGDGDHSHQPGRLSADAIRSTAASGCVSGFWRDADWLWCRDQKYRPVEPGTFPLAHGAPCRVGRLRGYGNAIVAEVAQAFIESYLESE